jgi:hypothetical protein
MISNTCEFSVSRVGSSDEVKVVVEIITEFNDSLRRVRGDCETGANSNPQVKCLSGLGNVAFFRSGSLVVYSGNKELSIRLGMYPANPVLTESDAIALARVALARL